MMKILDFVIGTDHFIQLNSDQKWKKIICIHYYITNNKWSKVDRLTMQFSSDIIGLKLDFFILKNNEIRLERETNSRSSHAQFAPKSRTDFETFPARFCARGWFTLSRWGSWPFNNAITYQFHANAVPSAFREIRPLPPLPPSTRCNSRALRLDGGQETASCRRRCRRHRTTKENGLG